MDPLTPTRVSPSRRSLHLSHAPFQPFPLQPHPSRPVSSLGSVCAVTGSPLARQASPFPSGARPVGAPNRVHFRLGPTFRLRLLPTPHCCDAVAFGCSPGFCLQGSSDFHRLSSWFHGRTRGAVLLRPFPTRTNQGATRLRPYTRSPPRALGLSHAQSASAE
jgi:hypothetical protein